MANVLITTLGRGFRADGGYRKAIYKMPDGTTSHATPFIGMALVEMLPHIDRLVVLGTPGSIWDAWWQCDEVLLEHHEDLFERISSNVGKEVKDESGLRELAGVLGASIKKSVECIYISESFDTPSQLGILSVISSIANKNDCVFIDVTHGFRHLPMLELLSAFLNRGKFHVCSIFYGAYEKTEEGITPVIDLAGLMNLQEWIEAMAVLRETGSVVPLSRIPSMERFRADLEQYQFFVQMNNVGNARGCSNRIRGLINSGMLPPEGELFKENLLSIFDWGADQDYAKRQLAQAKTALKTGDYLRAIILLNEATISACVDKSDQVLNVEARRVAEDKLYRKGERTWHLLRRLRNSTAHDGVRNDNDEREVKRMRTNRDGFEEGMRKIVAWVESQVTGSGKA